MRLLMLNRSKLFKIEIVRRILGLNVYVCVSIRKPEN